MLHYKYHLLLRSYPHRDSWVRSGGCVYISGSHLLEREAGGERERESRASIDRSMQPTEITSVPFLLPIGSSTRNNFTPPIPLHTIFAITTTTTIVSSTFRFHVLWAGLISCVAPPISAASLPASWSSFSITRFNWFPISWFLYGRKTQNKIKSSVICVISFRIRHLSDLVELHSVSSLMEFKDSTLDNFLDG